MEGLPAAGRCAAHQGPPTDEWGCFGCAALAPFFQRYFQLPSQLRRAAPALRQRCPACVLVRVLGLWVPRIREGGGKAAARYKERCSISSAMLPFGLYQTMASPSRFLLLHGYPHHTFVPLSPCWMLTVCACVTSVWIPLAGPMCCLYALVCGSADAAPAPNFEPAPSLRLFQQRACNHIEPALMLSLL